MAHADASGKPQTRTVVKAGVAYSFFGEVNSNGISARLATGRPSFTSGRKRQWRIASRADSPNSDRLALTIAGSFTAPRVSIMNETVALPSTFLRKSVLGYSGVGPTNGLTGESLTPLIRSRTMRSSADSITPGGSKE